MATSSSDERKRTDSVSLGGRRVLVGLLAVLATAVALVLLIRFLMF